MERLHLGPLHLLAAGLSDAGLSYRDVPTLVQRIPSASDTA